MPGLAQLYVDFPQIILIFILACVAIIAVIGIMTLFMNASYRNKNNTDSGKGSEYMNTDNEERMNAKK